MWWTWDAPPTGRGPAVRPPYLGYLALRRIPATEVVRGKRCAVAALVAAMDIPIDHFATNWWRTLHQGSSIDPLQPSKHLDAAHGIGLALGFLAVTLVYGWLLAHRYANEKEHRGAVRDRGAWRRRFDAPAGPRAVDAEVPV